MPTIPPERELRPASMEDRVATSRRIKAMFAPAPVLVPYEEWAPEIDALCREHRIVLATPGDLPHRMNVFARTLPPPTMTVAFLVTVQEEFYRTVYHDPTFTIDRSRLSLPRERLEDIKAAFLRGEANYPLVVATPSVIPPKYLPNPDGQTRKERRGKTLHRFLFDHLIRKRGIAVWKRDDPNVPTFLAQLRDLTLADLTRTDLRASTLVFDEHGWLPYLQALYPTLLRPTVTPGYLDLSFVAWERDPPADRVIPNAKGPRGGAVMIQNKSQLDAVAFRYPLITPSRHLALFSQYHAATGQHLDTGTWSWLFGIIDPKRFPDRPAVHVDWNADELFLYRKYPRYADSNGRLRGAR